MSFYNLDEIPSVVLLHGWGFDATIWQSLSQTLNPFVKTIALNLPGYGGELSLAPTIKFDEYAAMLLSKIPKNAMIVGWSLGGLVALQLAKLIPEKIFGVMTLATTPCFVAQEGWRGVSPHLFSEFYQAVQQDSSTALQQFCRWLAPTVELRQLYRFLCTQVCSASQATLLTTLNFLKNLNFMNDFSVSSCPVRHLHGGQDALVPMQSFYDSLGVTHFKIPDAGHALFITHPQVVLQHVLEMINVR